MKQQHARGELHSGYGSPAAVTTSAMVGSDRGSPPSHLYPLLCVIPVRSPRRPVWKLQHGKNHQHIKGVLATLVSAAGASASSRAMRDARSALCGER